jgi:hypothetical protein
MRIRTSRLLIPFFAGVSMAFYVGTAKADQITLSIPGLFRTTYSSARSVQIPGFNTSLGTLQSVTVQYTPEYSGTTGGVGTGPANSPNGWAIEFSGTIQLSLPGSNTIAYPLFNSQSGLVNQPGSPVFQAFGPTDLGGSTTITSNLSAFTTPTVNASLSWPQYTNDLFFSRGGTVTQKTRDLGAVGGTVTYNFTSTATPLPSALGAVPVLLGLCWIQRIWSKAARQ